MTRSSLPSTTDRLIRQVRWEESSVGWGGDAEVTLSLVDGALPARQEWVEGINENWNLWIFQQEADLREHDILILDDLGLALVVVRVAEFTWLDGEFHHYELVTSEHENSIEEIDADLP